MHDASAQRMLKELAGLSKRLQALLMTNVADLSTLVNLWDGDKVLPGFFQHGPSPEPFRISPSGKWVWLTPDFSQYGKKLFALRKILFKPLI